MLLRASVRKPCLAVPMIGLPRFVALLQFLLESPCDGRAVWLGVSAGPSCLEGRFQTRVAEYECEHTVPDCLQVSVAAWLPRKILPRQMFRASVAPWQVKKSVLPSAD
eukprot:15411504-Alexandrium_andersonii.AAC.1